MCKQHEAAEWLKRPAVLVKPLPARPNAALIAECNVSTDSVVATATVRTDGTMRRIVVNWGDGTINTLRNLPGHDVVIGQEQLPPGTFKIRHAYREPQDKKPFGHTVIIRVEDAGGGVDFCVNAITLTPRYRVTQYRTRINLESQCDSPFENTAEFNIRLTVGQQLVATWHWEPGQSIIPSEIFLLEGSLVSRELTAADPPVSIHFAITEVDPIFDDHISVFTRLWANDVSESVSNVSEGDGCKIRYTYDREVTLLVPMPSFGQVVVATADV
jgi:hypothetical protein